MQEGVVELGIRRGLLHTETLPNGCARTQVKNGRRHRTSWCRELSPYLACSTNRRISTSDELATNGPLTFQTWIPATIGRLAMRVFVMRGPVCARRRFRRAPGGGRSFFARQLEPRWAARSSERARCRDPQAPNAPRHGVGPGGHVPSNRLAPGPLWLTPRTKPCKGLVA